MRVVELLCEKKGSGEIWRREEKKEKKMKKKQEREGLIVASTYPRQYQR